MTNDPDLRNQFEPDFDRDQRINVLQQNAQDHPQPSPHDYVEQKPPSHSQPLRAKKNCLYRLNR